MTEKHLQRRSGKLFLHRFTGSKGDVRRAVELGCFFSVNEAMLSSTDGTRVLTEIPKDRLLTKPTVRSCLVAMSQSERVTSGEPSIS